MEKTESQPHLKTKTHRLNILPNNPENDDAEKVVGLGRFPKWLHRRLPKGGGLGKTEEVMRGHRLHTVCEEAKCPNLLECWSRKTATFLVLGKECTRSCGFCSIAFSKAPSQPDYQEPEKLAASVEVLGLQHVVITMVARDDLEDGGAKHILEIVKAVRKRLPQVTVEILTSDFAGKHSSLDIILESKPDIFNHNIETVKELTPQVRHKANYERTLDVLSYMKKQSQNMYIKSGLMVGFGENRQQVFNTIKDLKLVGCDIVTIGQYLQSSQRKLLVKSFIPPEEFEEYSKYGKEIGINQMYCGPFVRSSYNADLILKEIKEK